MFVSKVIGESLDPRVPSGAWGLFRLAAGKPRDGSVIITHLRDLQNPGGRNRFRVQIYGSQRVADEETGKGEVVAEFLTLMHG
jgi:hypothetical protein